MATKIDDSKSSEPASETNSPITTSPGVDSDGESASVDDAISDIDAQRAERAKNRKPAKRKPRSKKADQHTREAVQNGVPRVTVQISKNGGSIYRPRRRDARGNVMLFARVVKTDGNGNQYTEPIQVERDGEPMYNNSPVALSEGETHTLYADEVALMLQKSRAELIDCDGGLSADDIIDLYSPQVSEEEEVREYVFG